MLKNIINFSINNKLIVLLFIALLVGFGLLSVSKIPIGVVPDITNNQVQVITTSKNLSTQDIEKFITYPVELEMANLPGVVEIRSVSKFGLSVVTIVFEDDMGTYLPRQLIAEKIKIASEKIPVGFGSPEMGPITTGLGEIYQYILDVEPQYKHLYSTMDLRTIQDWNVKRKLSGIKGVVEVNTWGGFLKQYEVAINPNVLRSMNIALSDVFSALEKNNSIAGGGYIEKENKSYFIRGEGLVKTLSDIENIVVEKRNGIPVYIKNIAKVTYGKSNRFGAITGNGEGEKVMGQIMMLKNANSGKTIELVKNRVAEIQKTLPKGVFINGFLERSELIGKTTFTISENLIFGCLIVIFVVVLLLGNWRSGLVVASVIPLALLFAISMMYIFGVDANLMSLGAIDFGIIIDGAVIIVEYIAYEITKKSAILMNLPKLEQKSYIDSITLKATNKMMHSAIFGQIIIVIVFIPILSLSGVEGKMFIPMALTFCFALIGAMILCFTYVPVASALFLKPNKNKRTISVILIEKIENLYEPTLKWTLHNIKIVLTGAVVLLVSAILLFNTMGGEFVPTLDEGDFVIQPVIPTGTSLSKTIEITTEIEKRLKTFPEVKDVVSRIGAAEIPTDPMSMEESDVIIKLNPISEWVNATTKDELANKFKEALISVEGVDEYEFTQPIEMRFNELITGVRADIAIKVFGEDLELLNEKAKEIKVLISDIEGASDIIVEKTAGLPQMSIVYNRNKIAKYGLAIEDVNNIVSMAFSGSIAGNVFDGEKRFDLVVRFQENFKKDISNVEQIFIPLPNGSQIPLSEVAEINYSFGPAKISRDATKRRVVVGVNVRDRDLQSVVLEIQNRLNEKLILPVGYEINYGGQFENLESAKQRLLIAVPISLFLIFVLLYFAFSSVKDAILIYSAIPLSAVGGVWLLWLRDLPFSISAGVGFIALFGIAVLNGLVLIEHYKELMKEEFEDMKTLIIMGTKQRLRPVILTASAAALGFLPMAISTSAGAEVQRPLATVVVGGLITATLLTLIVLPVLFYIFNKGLKMNKNTLLVLLIVVFPMLSKAQMKEITFDEAVELAFNKNKSIESAKLGIRYEEQIKKTSFSLDRTALSLQHGQYNSYISSDNAFQINQRFELPAAYNSKLKLADKQIESSKLNLNAVEKEVLWKMKIAYANLNFIYEKQKLYFELDSLYIDFQKEIEISNQLGETNLLEKLTAETHLMELENNLKILESEHLIYETDLNALIQGDENFEILSAPLTTTTFNFESQNIVENPQLKYLKQQVEVQESTSKVEKSSVLPDVTLGYFNQSMIGNQTIDGVDVYFGPSKRYMGYLVTLGIPIFTKSNSKATSIQKDIAQTNYESLTIQIESNFKQEVQQYIKHKNVDEYYIKNALPQSELLFDNAKKLYDGGEISYLEYIYSIDQAIVIKEKYLNNVLNLNLNIINLEYFLGK